MLRQSLRLGTWCWLPAGSTEVLVRVRRRFGQHFLVDQAVIQEMLHAAAPKKDQNIVEIGPGLGALTEGLANSGASLCLIEIDRDLAAKLRRKYGGKAEVHEQDVLELQLADLGPAKVRLIGNLPYNISTPLLFHLLEQLNQILDMHFMLQKEVAERLAAVPGSKTYGRLSVMTQYYCEVEKLFQVAPAAFAPAPKVHSAAVRLTPRQADWPKHSRGQLAQLVKSAFGARRKTLRKALAGLVTEEQFSQAGLSSGARAENLSPSDYVRLAHLLQPQT